MVAYQCPVSDCGFRIDLDTLPRNRPLCPYCDEIMVVITPSSMIGRCSKCARAGRICWRPESDRLGEVMGAWLCGLCGR